jgi:hypothetical protein
VTPSQHILVEYFRCPEALAALDAAGPLPAESGFFRFRDAICYGRQAAGAPSPRADGRLVDASGAVSPVDGRLVLPFDLAEVVANLRYERYPRPEARTPLERISTARLAHALYYAMRPLLPIAVRKHFQKLRLSGWRAIPFPGWPIDATVETLMHGVVRALLEERRVVEFPFVWFWPEGAAGCLVMTHDVEGAAGAGFATGLMDLDDEYGVRSAFQLVPEAPYSPGLAGQCRCRGFEVNIHDFNHDGHLFRDRALFDARVAEINRYAREFGSRGFRSGAMYRRQEWFAAFELSFDMSVPSVAHFEPQQGGCCTVMPHFLGDLLELPLTTTQDYALLHYLGDYSIDLWKTQAEVILGHHGLVSFITHPDYLIERRARAVYVELLKYLAALRVERNLWMALPSEVDRWWRERSRMRLVPDGGRWRVEGPGSERARVGYLRLNGEGTMRTIRALAA